MDLHSKKIVGYSFGQAMLTDLVIKALENAYHTQQTDDGLIFHSDLGDQYTNDEFEQAIKTFNMTHSFSYKGSLYDNACIESFHTIRNNHMHYLDY